MPVGGSRSAWIGGAVLIHFFLVCAIKLYQGIGADVCWMSHVALALTAAGLLAPSPLYVSAALVAVLIPHSFWLFDWAGGFLFGAFPLGITRYLEGADLATWAGTAHHFYLIPLLVGVTLRTRTFAREAFPFLLILFASLSIVSRFGLPEGRNVNSAFALIPMVDWRAVHTINALPTLPFLLFLNVWMGLVMMLPTHLAFSRLFPARSTPERPWIPSNRSSASCS